MISQEETLKHNLGLHNLDIAKNAISKNLETPKIKRSLCVEPAEHPIRRK